MTNLESTLYSAASASTFLLPAAGMVGSAASSLAGAAKGAVFSGLYKAAVAQLPSSLSIRLPLLDKSVKVALENDSFLQITPSTALLGAAAVYIAFQALRPSPPVQVIINVTSPPEVKK